MLDEVIFIQPSKCSIGQNKTSDALLKVEGRKIRYCIQEKREKVKSTFCVHIN